jgi:4-diphosphocytidyl-2-C-methyl-D-erythritol kinase
VITEVLDAITQAGAKLARMSGSGATCFGVFDTEDLAENAALAIGANHPNWWVQATRLTT